MNAPSRLGAELSELLRALDPQAPLALRHVWLRDVLTWVRGREANPDPAVARLRLLLNALTHDPDIHARWQAWWQAWLTAVDLTPLLADFGFSPRNAFVSELGERLRRKWLPGTPDTTDAIELFMLCFNDARDERWVRRMDEATLAQLAQLLTPPAGTPALATVLDAVVFAASQVAALGFAPDVRLRMASSAQADAPFKDLLTAVQRLREQALAQPSPDPAALSATLHGLMHTLSACEAMAHTVYAHLDVHGISVGIVFRLQQLHGRIARIRALLDVFKAQHDNSAQPWRHLTLGLLQAAQQGRSVRALIGRSSQMTAAKVAESTAATGEHYITRNAAEYWRMFGRAAGGGAVLAFTTWSKMALFALGLSVFWQGWWAGLNYAMWFVLIQWLHLTVATKHPAMTAPAMVAKLRDLDKAHALHAFVDEVGHLFRTQIVAVMGNVGLVVPTVLLLSLGLQWATGQAMINTDQAHYTLHSLDLLGGSLLFAMLTGVLLFASSVVAGWTENAFVFYKVDSALAYHPRMTRWLGLARADRLARALRTQVSVLAANVSLGMMLGLVPAFATFFGLGLDIRHVTLAAGQLAAAAHTLGPEVLLSAGFWSAVLAVLLIGPINVAVSFYLAFRLALKAQAISDVNRQRITAALWRRIRHQPLSFFWPPKDSAESTPHG